MCLNIKMHSFRHGINSLIISMTTLYCININKSIIKSLYNYKMYDHKLNVKIAIKLIVSIFIAILALEVTINAIVGFKISCDEIQAAFKLSQNRNEQDFNSIIKNLYKEENPQAEQIAKAMEKIHKS